ncbi:uncharacterized protein LOC113648052 isoform X1 [Tachysurus ichikawai]
METQPDPFGKYGDADGWNGFCVSAHFLTDCLYEYQRQKEAIRRLQLAFCSDHPRKMARTFWHDICHEQNVDIMGDCTV